MTQTPYNIKDLAEFMRLERSKKQPFVFFTGAGCSVSAGIPLAYKLIEEMNTEYSLQLKPLSDDDRKDYGKCMAQIGRDERRKFLKKYIDNAKINWAHIALASLLQKGYISRVMTFNFDNLLARSCGLLGLYPATYDLTAADLNLYNLIDNTAIVHIHGQSHGFVQLNSDAETQKHAESLKSLVCSTLNSSSTIFIGYSGLADAFFSHIESNFRSQHNLFWVGMDNLPQPHVKTLMDGSSLANYMQCPDGADLFLIELARELECFPPSIFKDPYENLLNEINHIADFPTIKNNIINQDKNESDSLNELSDDDILKGLKERLKKAQILEIKSSDINVLDLFLQGKYEQLIELSPNLNKFKISDQIIIARSFIKYAFKQNDLNKKINIYSKFIEIFNKKYDVKIQKMISLALFNKAVTFRKLDKLDDAITTYDNLIARFGNSSGLVLQEQVAKALVNKGIALGNLFKYQDAIVTYDNLISRFGDSSELVLQEQVARAFVSKGVSLRKLDKSYDAIATYDHLIARFGDASDVVLQERIAKALINKGIALRNLDKSEDAITAFDNLISRFGNSSELILQEGVAKALVNKGIVLRNLDKADDAIATFDNLILRFGNSSELVLQELVADALVNKGVALVNLDKADDAIATFDNLISRFGNSSERVLHEQAGLALNGKAYILLLQSKENWNNATQSTSHLIEAQSLLEQAKLKAAEKTLATILGNLAYVQWLLGNHEQARIHLTECLEKGGEEIYLATLEDIEKHTIPPDAGFKALLENLWTAQQAKLANLNKNAKNDEP